MMKSFKTISKYDKTISSKLEDMSCKHDISKAHAK